MVRLCSAVARSSSSTLACIRGRRNLGQSLPTSITYKAGVFFAILPHLVVLDQLLLQPQQHRLLLHTAIMFSSGRTRACQSGRGQPTASLSA